MASKRQRIILPIWGYLVLNFAFLLFLALAYHFGSKAAEAGRWELVGVFPVFLVCYLAFTVVCIFDAVYDRVSAARPETEQITSPRTSKDSSGKQD